MYRNVIITIVAMAVIAWVSGCSNDDTPTNVKPVGNGDTRAPEEIADGILSYSPAAGTVRLEWTAPCDDDSTESVASYEIRYAVTRGYDPPQFWDLSTPVTDAPDPLEPGMRQHYTFTDVRRARDFYVGIRSVDESGNRSAAGDLAMVHIPGFSFEGRCIDVFSGEAIAGLEVTLTSDVTSGYTTDAEGRFAHEKELDTGVNFIDIRTGSASGAYHTLRQPLVLDRDSTHTFTMIPVRPVNANWAPNLLALFKIMSRTSSAAAQLENASPGLAPAASPAYSTVLAKWHQRPVACYVPSFVNDHGVDYADQARSAAQRWMDRTGQPLFTFVDAPPDTGIILSYPSSMGGAGSTIHTKGDDGHPIRDEIRVIDSFEDPTTVWLVFLHELGHTIQLGHVTDRNFIMYVGQPLPHDVSDDEVAVVELHESLPTRVDMATYDESSP
jgi:hypothetical protein